LLYKEALNNVSEAVRARQKSTKKRSLQVVNEHFELIFNNVLAAQVIIQCFLNYDLVLLGIRVGMFPRGHKCPPYGMGDGYARFTVWVIGMHDLRFG
jgi:hypothetical protein